MCSEFYVDEILAGNDVLTSLVVVANNVDD